MKHNAKHPQVGLSIAIYHSIELNAESGENEPG
jgi:hypothetical protein